MGLTLDASGNLFIANSFSIDALSGSGGIIKWVTGTGAQSTVNTSGTGLLNPTSIAVDASEDLFVADYLSNRILELPAKGNARSIGSGLHNPAGVVVDAAGDVFITDENNKQVVEVAGTSSGPGTGAQITILPGLGLAWGLALDGPGNLYVTSLFGNLTEIPLSQAPTLPPFPPTGQGMVSAPQPVPVYNIGNQPLASTGFIASANFSTNSCGGLAPGAACTLNVAFAPSFAAFGPITGGSVSAASVFNGPAVIGGLSGTALRGQTILFGPIGAKTLGSAPFALGAASTSGLPVSFNSQTPAVCLVNGATVTLVSTGLCTIQATQPGNSSYAPATPVNQSFTVSPPPGFSLTAGTNTVTVTPMTPGSDTITITPANGFTGAVTLSVSGLPPNISAYLNPGSVTTSGSVVLTFDAAYGTPSGHSTTVALTGVVGNLSTTIHLTLNY